MTLQVCRACGARFEASPVINGQRLNLLRRKRCLECRPHRPQRKPRKPVHRPKTTRICDSCGQPFALRQIIDGKLRYLYRRRFCTVCSPFGAHNTSKHAPPTQPDVRHARRRHRRTESFLRYQRKRRRKRKEDLINARGGKCEGCGYARCLAVLEFHHRDPSTKEFEVGRFTGSTPRLLIEAAKCDLLCANCHRLRHVALDIASNLLEVVEHRRRRKIKAVLYMGGLCEGCGLQTHPWVFEFHHRDAKTKDFGLSESGIPHNWDKTVAELAKCVMLCANCHREVHAGVRDLDDGLLGLAETAGAYAA